MSQKLDQDIEKLVAEKNWEKVTILCEAYELEVILTHLKIGWNSRCKTFILFLCYISLFLLDSR